MDVPFTQQQTDRQLFFQENGKHLSTNLETVILQENGKHLQLILKQLFDK